MSASPAIVRLRDVAAGDVDQFFEHQSDPVAHRMAAFGTKNPGDRDAFMTKWGRIMADAAIVKRTILLDDHVAGHVASFERLGQREVTYWLGREFWGRGVATRALSLFLNEETTRPLYARVVRDNGGSLRVLEKCGFAVVAYERAFAEARGEEVEEAILVLR
ncbi:MAG: GNAT family N-acetyltransferase [Phycisphaerae bacterium]|nr:GNAT family N-acetyltransferase [Phycisphaerae bacterium]